MKSTAEPQHYTFKYCDIDYYRHVNTVRYVQMLLNRFSLEFFDTHEIERMELTFMRESLYGQTVAINRADNGSETLFSLNNSDTSEPLLFAMLRFRSC